MIILNYPSIEIRIFFSILCNNSVVLLLVLFNAKSIISSSYLFQMISNYFKLYINFFDQHLLKELILVLLLTLLLVQVKFLFKIKIRLFYLSDVDKS